MKEGSKRTADWKKENIISRKVVEFNSKEADIAEFADKRRPFSSYVKKLIREDMIRRKEQGL